MENITIGQVIAVISTLTIIVGFFISVYKIVRSIEKMKDSIFDKLDILDNRIDDLDESQCKNYLVRYLKDVERGEQMDEVEEERAYELYDHYTNTLHKNSYIHKKWDKVMK